VRLSDGRESMSDELQALCFAAGANSIFYGEKLLTTGNPDTERDMALFARLGLRPMQVESATDDAIDACSTTVHAGITQAA
jgi:biotin synthase